MDRAKQAEIIAELQVVQDFDAERELDRRINFLADYVKSNGLRGYVLGISGGVDSTVAGRIAQLACEKLRADGYDAHFVAMRLPYGIQADEDDAQRAVEFIRPDELLTLDVGPATDAIWEPLLEAATDPVGSAGSGSSSAPVDLLSTDWRMSHFVKGNVKARERMIAQYTVAGARSMLVIGTDQAAEAVVGFFTKFGDGAADVTPLTGLPKRRVRELARLMGTPKDLVEKTPTADLESDKPLHPDELALGLSYDEVDDYLEGLEVSPETEAMILRWHQITAHKRALPVTPQDFETRIS